MNTTLGMWRKSLSQLIMMKDKKEWDELDILSKWFIATRSAVGTVTLYSGLIGGLLAWQDMYANGQPFPFITWLILTLGLFMAHGTNNLLKQGATLITTAQDIVDVLAPILGRSTGALGNELAASDNELAASGSENSAALPDIRQSERERIAAALGPSPVDIDELIRVTGLPTRTVHIVLLELDLAGRLQRHGRQLVSLVGLD